MMMISFVRLEANFIYCLLLRIVFRYWGLVNLWWLTLLVIWQGIVVIDDWNVFNFHRFIVIVLNAINLILIRFIKNNFLIFSRIILECHCLVILKMMSVLTNRLYKLVHIVVLAGNNSYLLVLLTILLHSANT